jgi:hypothetical protein
MRVTQSWRLTWGIYSFGLALLLSFCANRASAQGTTTGTILGVVTDSSGAAVPGVEVTATNEETAIERHAVTDNGGNFTIPFLAVGSYRVKVEHQGFKPQIFTGIKLEIGLKVVVNFTLTVGSMQQQVEVQAQPVTLNTQTSDLGQVIDNRRVTELPLNGRQFIQLVLLSSGATPEPQGIFSAPFAIAGQSPNVSGNRSDANNYLLDGIPLNDPTYNHLSASPSVDAIDEFKIQISLYSAEFGSAPGSQVNVALKSGANGFHGSAWEFLRNDIFDARNFFDRKKPPYRQNQFGGTFSGPVVKDKTFFFFNYEGLRVRQGITIVSTVPTLAMRSGVLSGVARIFDPATFNAATNTQTEFSQDTIPQARINVATSTILQLVPLPNVPGAGLSRNFVGFGNKNENSDQFNGRLDHHLGVNDSLFGRVTYSDITDLEPIPGASSFQVSAAPLAPPGFGQNTALKNLNIVAEYTHLFSTDLLNQFRLGYNYTRVKQTQQNQADFSSQVGIQGNSASRVLSNGIPTLGILGFSTLGGTTFDLNWRDHNYMLMDDVAYTHGKHSLKAGFSGQRVYAATQFLLSPRGSFNFRNIFSSDPQNPSTTGSPFADFLLGLPNTAAVGNGNPLSYLRDWQAAAYLQDDWRVTPKLTLNLGVRYEVLTRWKEKNNRWANWDPVTGNFVIATPSSGQINPNAQIANFPTLHFVTSASAGWPVSLVDGDDDNIAPRLGFAYSLRPRTVIRGGYGIFFQRDPVVASNGLSFNPPFFGNLSFTNSARTNLIAVQNALISTGTVVPNAQGLARNNPNGYIQQWSLNIEQELSSSSVFKTIYLGSKGTDLSGSINPNQAVPGTTPVAQRLPFPTLSPTIALGVATVISSYNSLTLDLEKRYSSGLTFGASYTFSKSLDDGTGGNSTSANNNKPQNSRDIRTDYGPSIFDVRHRFVFNAFYELPFGPAKRWMGGTRGAAAHIFGGWSLTGIQILQSGVPFSTILGTDRSGSGALQDRPNAVGDPNAISDRTAAALFNTAAFALQPAGQFGNAGRNTIRMPGFYNTDFSVIKSTKLTESQRIEFRAEFFNLFNTTHFNLPNRVFATADFGKVFSAQSPRNIQFGLKYVF